MTHFTTQERGTDTVLRRPDNSQRQDSISSLIPRLNLVHHSTFVSVEITLSFRGVLGHACSLTADRAVIFFSHFRKFSLSRSALESKELSAVQLDCSLNSLAFPPRFYRRSTARRNARCESPWYPSIISVVIYHDVHQLRLERDRFSQTLPSFGESPKDSLTFGFQSTARRYANASVALYRPDLLCLIRYGTL